MIHGLGDVGWYRHLVERELRERGHEVLWRADLPGDDDAAGLREYADTVVGAIGNGGDLVVVGMSLGGFTAPLVADQLPVEVLVTRMIPVPEERADD